MTPAWLARFVVILVLSFLAWASVGRAEAQEKSCVSNASGCTFQEAKDWAWARMLSNGATCNKSDAHYSFNPDPPSAPGVVNVWFCGTSNRTQGYYNKMCPPGTEWSDVTKRCNPPCEERNVDHKGVGANSWVGRCLDGCWFEVDSNRVQTQWSDGTKLNTLYTGEYRYTGAQCTNEPDPPPIPPGPPEKEACAAAAAGQTMCVQADGQHCASASNGKQFCWRPGETGEKTSGPDMQKSNAGPEAIPPLNMQLPSGDSLQKVGESTTVNVTQGGNTSTTTVTNYNTTSGTNAGTGPDQSKGQGDSDDGKDDGSATGGGDCETPPVITGDQVLGMVATQAWATRCAVDAGNAAKVTGDVGDCKSEFTVEGTNANAIKLRAMRAQVCGDKADNEGDANALAADSEAMESEYDSVFQEGGDGGSGGGLDANWFTGGSSSCPDLSASLPSWAGGGSWQAPAQFCSTLSWLSLLFQAIAMVWGIRIVGNFD